MSRRKQFLILTSDSGFGHRSAANSIAKALELCYPNEAITTILNPIFEEQPVDFLQKAEINYDKAVKNYPNWYRFAYEISDSRSACRIIENTIDRALHHNIRQIVDDLRPDVIVTTNQMFSAPVGTAIRAMKQRPPFFAVVTDLADVHSMWFNSSPDRFFVASEMVKDKAVASGIDPRKICISGIPVDPAFSPSGSSKTELKHKMGLDPQLTTILVVGSQRVSGIMDNLAAMEILPYAFQVVVIAGGDCDLYTQLNQRTWKFPIHIENFVTNMPEWMACADILMTKAGGLILSEGLAAGLPILMIGYLPGQEEGNARFVIENQVGVIINTPKELSRLLDFWLKDQHKVLDSIALKSRQLGHADAAFLIAEALWHANDRNIRTNASVNTWNYLE